MNDGGGVDNGSRSDMKRGESSSTRNKKLSYSELDDNNDNHDNDDDNNISVNNRTAMTTTT